MCHVEFWVMRTMVVVSGLLGLPGVTAAQVPDPQEAPYDRSSRRCFWWSTGLASAGVAGALYTFDQAWYSGFERGPMRAFNDGDEWLQVDKYGHAFSGYTLTHWGHALFGRCGGNDRAAMWAAAGVSLAFTTGIELLDGTSAQWGFSWWDMAANVLGTGLYVGQHLGWGDQRFRLKISARHTGYAALRPELLGSGPAERLLKDYNGMTIWLTALPGPLFRTERIPSWLGVSFGAGGEGMLTASPPSPGDAPSAWPQRYRRFFLAPDIDLTRIRTRSKVLRTAFTVLSIVKVPAPALEFRGNGRVVAHWFYF